MYALIHDHPDCGAIAFLLPRKPKPEDPRRSADVLHTDGRPVAYGVPIRCDYCSEKFQPKYSSIRKMT